MIFGIIIVIITMEILQFVEMLSKLDIGVTLEGGGG